MINRLFELLASVEDRVCQHHLARCIRRHVKLEIEKTIPPPPPETDLDYGTELNFEEREMARTESKITAIRMIRQRMHITLHYAKQYVENYLKSLDE